MNQKVKILLAVFLVSTLFVAPATASEATSRGLKGAGIGALLGGIIGGNWEDAAVGALAGGGIGYISGNEKDKKNAKESANKRLKALEKAQVSSDPETAYRPPAENRFVGSVWRVLSIDTDDDFPEYASMVITFTTNSKLTTMAINKKGEAETWVENYRIVSNDTMIVSGKDPQTKKPYAIKGIFTLKGDKLTFAAPESRTVLERVRQ